MRQITYAVEPLPTQYQIVRIANGNKTVLQFGNMKSSENHDLMVDHAKELSEAEADSRKDDADLMFVVDCRKRDPDREARVEHALKTHYLGDVTAKDLLAELEWRAENLRLSELKPHGN